MLENLPTLETLEELQAWTFQMTNFLKEHSWKTFWVGKAKQKNWAIDF